MAKMNPTVKELKKRADDMEKRLYRLRLRHAKMIEERRKLEIDLAKQNYLWRKVLKRDGTPRALREKEEEIAKTGEEQRVIENELYDLRTELERLEGEQAKQTAELAAKLADELWQEIAAGQAHAVAAAKKLVALRAACEEKLPKRVLIRRWPGHYLEVEPLDPTMRAIYTNEKGEPRMHIEFFRALAGHEAGNWRLIDGQDLTPPPPEEVEVLLGDPVLPEPVDRVTGLDLGYLVAKTANMPPGEDASYASFVWYMEPEERAAAEALLKKGGEG